MSLKLTFGAKPCVPLSLQQGSSSDQQVTVAFNKSSVEIDDEEVRLSVELSKRVFAKCVMTELGV